MPYEPAVAETGEVTFRLVEALDPGLNVIVGLPKTADQPLGTLDCKLNVAPAQLVESLFLTVILKVTELPGFTAAGWDGVMVTVGAVFTHCATPEEKFTRIEHPALLQAIGATLTPASLSWKVRPTANAGSSHELVSGVISNR